MKRFRCIFYYSTAQTTVEVDSKSVDAALTQALAVVPILDATSVEIWDDKRLLETVHTHHHATIAA